MRPLLLDLFCGAGGAAMGYHRAGFDIVGIDHKPQPNYPFEFIQGDALDTDLWPVAEAIHASPPCQFASAYKRRPGVAEGAINMIPQARVQLEGSGLPYVIENVDQRGARESLRSPLRLCGSMFGLDVQRHRLFETSWRQECDLGCDHSVWTPRFPSATNRQNLRKTVEVGVYRIPLGVQRKAMGIHWMTLPELSQAIPPAYTEWIGLQLMKELS